VIVRTLEQLPPDQTTEQLAAAEHTLLDVARQLRPREVAIAGARYLAYLNPDGTLVSEEQQDRVRELLLHPRPDGSYDLTGRLTAGRGAQLLATLTPPRGTPTRRRRRPRPPQPPATHARRPRRTGRRRCLTHRAHHLRRAPPRSSSP